MAEGTTCSFCPRVVGYDDPDAGDVFYWSSPLSLHIFAACPECAAKAKEMSAEAIEALAIKQRQSN